MELAHEVVGGQLRYGVGGQRRASAGFHLRDGADRRADQHELGRPRRRPLQQRPRLLEQQQHRVRVDHHVGLQVLERQGRGRAVVRRDGGVGHYHVQVR